MSEWQEQWLQSYIEWLATDPPISEVREMFTNSIQNEDHRTGVFGN